jgi:hypothetical protein
VTELGTQIQSKMKEYSLLLNESETLRRLLRCRARKMSSDEALNWFGVLYELVKRCDTLVGAGRTLSFNPHLLPNTAKLYGPDGAAVQSTSSRCQCLASGGIGKGSALPIGGRERKRKPKRVDPSACTSFEGTSNLSRTGLITH